jgi:serine/threonine protein kinase
MSQVFRARLRNQKKLGEENSKDIALKILEKTAADYAENLLLLKNEAKFAQLVAHPRVVKVFSLEEDINGARMIMEFMAGGSLHDVIASEEKRSERECLETGLEILKALAAAYDKGIIHCDLKPANILFSSSGGAKLGDFGLAQSLTRVRLLKPHLMATPDYVAPEVLAGEQGNFRSDIYGLGGSLYHAITGHPPHLTEGKSFEELRRLKRHPVKLSSMQWNLHPETCSLITRMLEYDQAKRFVSYPDLESAFRRALDNLDRLPRAVSQGGGRTLLLKQFLAFFLKEKFFP